MPPNHNKDFTLRRSWEKAGFAEMKRDNPFDFY
jgi:hypothetical protein